MRIVGWECSLRLVKPQTLWLNPESQLPLAWEFIYSEVGLYYAYNSATDSCEELQYGGCEGNRNKFESIEECEGICKSAAPPLPPDETISTGELVVGRPRHVSKSALLRLTEEEVGMMKTNQTEYPIKRNMQLRGVISSWIYIVMLSFPRHISSLYFIRFPCLSTSQTCHILYFSLPTSQLDDTDLPTFCEMFEANYPDAAAIVKDLNNITSTEIQADLLEDLMAEVHITRVLVFWSSE